MICDFPRAVKHPPGAFVLLPGLSDFPEEVNDMRNLLRYMPLVSLLAPCLALYAQPRNPYNTELQAAQQQWTSAGKMEKLVLLDRIFHLRDFVDDRSRIQQELEAVRRSTAETELVRTEAGAYLDDLQPFRLPSQP